jgi:hypothetical protein
VIASLSFSCNKGSYNPAPFRSINQVSLFIRCLYELIGHFTSKTARAAAATTTGISHIIKQDRRKMYTQKKTKEKREIPGVSL